MIAHRFCKKMVSPTTHFHVFDINAKYIKHSCCLLSVGVQMKVDATYTLATSRVFKESSSLFDFMSTRYICAIFQAQTYLFRYTYRWMYLRWYVCLKRYVFIFFCSQETTFSIFFLKNEKSGCQIYILQTHIF